MRTSTDLFDLIHSLTSAEKGYFKKYANMQGSGEKKYLKLFNAINEQKQYAEDKLKQKFKKEISNFSAAKNYLYEQILDAIRASEKETMTFTYVNKCLEYASILFHKKLYDQSEEELNKGMERAKRIEQPELILLYFGQLLRTYRFNSNYEKLDEFVEKDYEAYQKVAGLNTSKRNFPKSELSLPMQLISLLTL